MKIETKYNIGDKLFYATNEGKLIKAKVRHIDVFVGENSFRIKYLFELEGNYNGHTEEENCKDSRIFESKEDYYKYIIDLNKD